jgi:hypothetical protein
MVIPAEPSSYILPGIEPCQRRRRKLPGSMRNVQYSLFRLLPLCFLTSTSAHAHTGYCHSRFYFLVPVKPPDRSIRPERYSGTVSEVAKRTQRGSKEEAMRRTEAKTLDRIGFDSKNRRFSRRIYHLSRVLPKSVPGFRGQRHIFGMTGVGKVYFCFISGPKRSFRVRQPAPVRAADKNNKIFTCNLMLWVSVVS